MPNKRTERVTVHHPTIKRQATVTAAKAEVMAKSGWEPGPLPPDESAEAAESAESSGAEQAPATPRARNRNRNTEE